MYRCGRGIALFLLQHTAAGRRRYQLWSSRFHIPINQAHEMHLGLGVVTEHERWLCFLGADDLQGFTLASAICVGLLEGLGLERAGTTKPSGCLATDHVGILADRRDA